ncbi:MAG: polysaccharide biosynthesis protein [Oscillospiraceae bacterium]|nr:polysaccharide biosynthesis protein [Oscillospiraceae bacterium]
MAEKKRPSFMMNVLTIIFSQIVVKLFGFVYRVVLYRVPGWTDETNGYYNFGFQIYALLLAISSVGIPNAISKLISEKCAMGNYRGAVRIFKISLALFASIGGALSLLLYFGAGFFSTYILSAPGAVYSMRVLSPAIFFVSVSSVIRGFFMGQHNAKATSTSQILEQLLKTTTSIAFVMLVVGSSAEYMAAAATLATTVSTVLSFMYLLAFTARNKKELYEKAAATPEARETQSALSVAKSVLWVSIPISLGSIVTSLNRVLDIITVNRGLITAFASRIPDPTALEKNAATLSGILSKTDVLINLPLAINIAFATVLVPTVAGAYAVKDYSTAAKRVSFSLLTSIIIALPCAAGYAVLADGILRMIYPSAASGAVLFMMLTPTVFFSAMSQTIYGGLQGMGKIFVPAISVLCGGVAKLIINLTLIPMEGVNIYGAPIGSIACQGIAFFVSFYVLRKNLPFKIDYNRYYLRPIISTGLMAAVVWALHHFGERMIGNTIATVLSIAIGAVVYFVMIFALRVFTPEEMRMLPFGDKIAKALGK